MRAVAWTASVLALGAAVASASGCGRDASSCDLALTCPGFAEGTGGQAVDLTCLHEPMLLDGGGPNADCGLFADPDAPAGGDGSKSAPFKSLQAALDQAAIAGHPVYACGKTFAERVHVPAGVTLYGALDCDAGWVWNGQKRTFIAPAADTTLAPGTSEIALRLDSGKGAVVEDVDVIAPDAKVPGVSSIALVAAQATATLTRSHLTAGKGAAGTAGADGDAIDLDGFAGDQGLDVCTTGANSPGGAGVMKTCPSTGGMSAGGKGGDGGSPDGSIMPSAGGNGTPGSSQLPTAGKGGAGETLGSACQSGGDGANGANGMIGTGADPKALGALSAAGFAGTSGGDGTDGKPGEGGGGGGGSRGADALVCMSTTSDRFGASGGSGGSGGCGGQHGGGGLAGGSSIALASVQASLTLSEVTLTAASGGAGGAGGNGQSGGASGKKGLGGAGAGSADLACDGGNGGKGGAGGPGGGGRGGHSLGIAYTGAAPKGGAVMTIGTPGMGGAGGMGDVGPGGNGASGVAAQVLAFQ